MSKPISTLFKDMVAPVQGKDSDHLGPVMRDSDLAGLPEIIGVSISSEPSDLFPYIDSLD